MKRQLLMLIVHFRSGTAERVGPGGGLNYRPLNILGRLKNIYISFGSFYFILFFIFLLLFFLNIILRLLTKHILQLQNLKLKESIYRYYRLDQNYIKTRKNSTAVVIIPTITIDLLINRLFR